MRESPARLGAWTRSAALGAALFLAACQPEGLNTTGQSASPNVDGVSYNLFFNQGQHVDQLARANRFDDVSRVFGGHRGFFDAGRMERHRPALTQAAEALNAARRPETAETLAIVVAADPARTDQWPALRMAIARGDKAVADYDMVALLATPEFRDPDIDRLRETLSALNTRLLEGAAAAYQAYDHLAAASFFEVYPATLEAKSFKAANFDAIEPRLRAAALDRLTHFASVTRQAGALDEAMTERMSNLILSAHFRASGGQPRDLRTLLAGLNAVRAAGFEPKRVEGMRVGFAQATSQTLLRTGAIEFPAEVDIDLPFEATKIDLDRAIEDPIAQTADFLIVFDVAMARNNRRVAGMDPIRSRAVVGTRREPNPEFTIRQNELNMAQMEFQGAQMRQSLNSRMHANAGLFGLIGIMADAAAASAAGRKVDEVMTAFQATPQMIDVPVFQDYAYNQARVQASRAMTVNYYVIDRRAQTYFKSTFDVSENQEFRVNYNVEDTDPMATQIRASAHKEDDVTEWEQAPIKVKLSQLVDHYLKNPAREQRMPTLVALREEMLRDKNTAIASFRANRVEDSRRTDHRMESVVAIHLPNGLGTGFYVTPDLVMTNYHVVENARLVEIRLSNGQETFGRVEASDVRLDLALIRVQNRGKPIQFFEGNRLDLGSQVDILGHPTGLSFTLTRGVISAVRQAQSPNRVGGGQFWQVQFDAAISGGNSGGPVFMGDRVIGVVSWSRLGRDRTAQNLNFGIHYREVLDWLKEKNVQVITQR
jgi:serine protease Do